MSPLATTVTMRPPTLSPVLRLPDVAATRSLLDFPRLSHPAPAPVHAGRVTGVATTVHAEPAPEPVVPEAVAPEVVVDARPAPRPVVTLDRPSVSAPVLTRAVDEYVAEPVEPAVPHQAPDLGRLLDVVGLPAAGMDAAAAMAALAGFSSQVAAPPPRFESRPETQPERAVPVEQPPTERIGPRPNLGQSRRLGVGRPGAPPEPEASPEPANADPTPESAHTDALPMPEPPHPDPLPASRLEDVPAPIEAVAPVPITPLAPPVRSPRRFGLGEPISGDLPARPRTSRPGNQPPASRPPTEPAVPDQPPASPQPAVVNQARPQPQSPQPQPQPPPQPPRPPSSHPEPPRPQSPPPSLEQPATGRPASEPSRSWVPEQPTAMPAPAAPRPAAHPTAFAETARPAALPMPGVRPAPTTPSPSNPPRTLVAPPAAAEPPAPVEPPATMPSTPEPPPATWSPPTSAEQVPPTTALPRRPTPADPLPFHPTEPALPQGIPGVPAVVPVRPVTLPTGPTYRAALATLPPPVDVAATTITTPTTASIPSDLSIALRPVLGVDISDVPIRRGPEVTSTARVLHARAYTTGGEIHLPAEAGALDTPTTRALLAHELVHAAQQRVLGSALPLESSPEGQALEASALATERWFRGEAARPTALVHRPPAPESPMAMAAVEETRELARQVDQLAAAAQQAPTTQRAPETAALPAPVQPPPAAPAPDTGSAMPTGTVTRSWSLTDVIAEPPREAPDVSALHHALAGLRQSVAELSERPEPPAPPDLDDQGTLDDLASKLFGRIRSRLRRELLVDRERTGRLTDFG
jgi:hypothetical protein